MINRSYYPKALSWFILSLIISSFNDLIAKQLAQSISSFQIVFLRFTFGSLILMPFIARSKDGFKTNYLFIHLIRGLLLFIAITIWCIGLKEVPIVMITLLSFAIPLFFIILASFFLKERIGLRRLLITLVGFLGVLVVIDPAFEELNQISWLLLLAVLLFAGLDVINKKYINKETTLNMLFYSSLATSLFSLIPAILTGWIWPSSRDILLCFILGAGANLILYAILKAFSLVDASALSPLRYLELVISAILGYLFFAEIPNSNIYFGALIIISSNLILAFCENKKLNK